MADKEPTERTSTVAHPAQSVNPETAGQPAAFVVLACQSIIEAAIARERAKQARYRKEATSE